MSEKKIVEVLKTKRFVIRKSLIGKNVVISFTNKKHKKKYHIIMMKCIIHIKKSLKVWIVFKNTKVILIQIVYQSFVEIYKQLLNK